MKIPANISATAFVASQARARAVEVSKDLYSRLWVTSEIADLGADYAKNVYPYDDLELALRCRFFLERIQAFVKASDKPTFINIAAGFTSYPFLIEFPCRCIEVDYQHILEFKSSQTKMWQADGTLPKREIAYFPTDLRDGEDLNNLEKMIGPWVTDCPSYILLEGITYYWDAAMLRRIFEIFRRTQSPGSIIAFDFWKPDIVHQPVFQRLEKYLAARFGFAARTYNLFDTDFINSIDGYEVVELTNVSEQERVYCQSSILQDVENRLSENYVVLRKVSPQPEKG